MTQDFGLGGRWWRLSSDFHMRYCFRVRDTCFDFYDTHLLLLSRPLHFLCSGPGIVTAQWPTLSFQRGAQVSI